MSEETVSFYQIAKELAEEEQISVEVYDAEREVHKNHKASCDGKVQDQSKFDTYRKKRQESL
ncbi:MAG: hypothetical protein H6Q68_3423 [Firmicutes bacterium]|nr:hypothetical protein [Bacillota bacterium]